MKYISKWWSIETAGHIIMLSGALSSYFNLESYLVKLHSIQQSVALSIGIGFGLMVLSIILSKIDKENVSLFRKMLIAVIAVALMSGTMQTLAYSQHSNIWISALLGYGLPLTTELFVSLGMAAFEEDNRKKIIRNAEQTLKDTISLSVAKGASKFDTGLLDKVIQKSLDKTAIFQVHEIFSEMNGQEWAQDGQGLGVSGREVGIDGQVHMPTTFTATSQKNKANKENELKRFALFLSENYNGINTNDLNISEICVSYGKSRRTINRYLTELTQADIINGHIDATLIKELI